MNTHTHCHASPATAPLDLDTLVVFRGETMRYEDLADKALPPLMGPFAIVGMTRDLESKGGARVRDVSVRLAKAAEIERFLMAGAR